MALKKINDVIQIFQKKRNQRNENTITLCSCAINKKLSTPYDFLWYDVIRERVKNPLKLMFGSLFDGCARAKAELKNNLRPLLVRYK